MHFWRDPDADHVGGLTTVLQAISTTAVIYNGQTKTTQVFQNFANEIQRQAIPTVIVRTGTVIALNYDTTFAHSTTKPNYST